MRRHIVTAGRDARGMTLLELMIVLAISSLVAGAVFSVFMTSLTTYWKGDINTQVQQGGRVAYDRLTRDLRSARRLYSGGPWGGFTFAVACTPNPQISFVLPHYGNMTLADSSVIYGTDADSSGRIPYDGSYVSYYLAGSPAGSSGSATPNSSGPYLQKTVYDINGVTLSTVTIASNITSLAFSAGGACPTIASREVTVTVTASQNPASQNIPPSTAVLTMDVTLRN